MAARHIIRSNGRGPSMGRCHGRLLPALMASWLLLACGPAARPEAPSLFEKNGPALLLVDAPRDKEVFTLKLADVLGVTLQVDGSKKLEVQAPEKITASPKWRLVKAIPPAIMELGKDRVRWRQTYIFEALRPGDFPLQIEPLRIREGPGEFRQVTWRPMQVQVVTAIAVPDLKTLRDPTAIEPLPPLPEAPAPPWQEVSAGAVLVALLALVFFWWRRRSRTSLVPAEQWALRELNRLLALHLPDHGKIEQYHTLLANVVRRYLERKFQLPARRRTTPEFLVVLQASSQLSGPQREFLGDFLKRCDLAKFAGAAAAPAECLDLGEKVRTFVLNSIT
jgi:hypothetical protein